MSPADIEVMRWAYYTLWFLAGAAGMALIAGLVILVQRFHVKRERDHG